jgi:hypothetical protein
MLCLLAMLLLTPDAALFRDPPKAFRPWVIWWWFGNASSTADLTYELAQMDRAGIGGAQIFPCYPLSADDPGRGIRNVPLFSPDYISRFRAAVEEARRRRMALFSAGGSGWPLGGPWITRELSSRMIAMGFTDIRGPAALDGPLPKPDAARIATVDRLEALVAVNRATGERRVLAAPADGRLRWQAPPGQWRVHAFYSMFTNQVLERGSPDSTGLVLDHFNPRALDLQLSQLEKLLPAVGPAAGTMTGFAADSLELEDSNWTPGFLAEFVRRRGYDLTPRLPDLWERISPESGAVRQDFLETLSELMLDGYFRRYTDWARGHGLKTIVQAHGTIADPLAAYGAVDVPDVETMWPGSERQSVNLRSRRLGVSAAHIYGRSVVTAESYTWLRMPRFLVTLGQMKAASDALYIDGVNHIKAHGYSSSPRAAGKPGWAFYASTLINHNQTWWPHFPALAAYLARMNYLMQSGEYVADLSLYHNLHDARANWDTARPEWLKDYVWRRPDRDPGMDAAALIAIRLRDCAQQLQDAGYGFDVVNDAALPRRMLIFHKTEAVPLATLRRIRDLKIPVIAVGHLPRAPVGLNEWRERKGEFATLVDQIWKHGRGVLVPDLDGLRRWLDSHVTSDFRGTAPGIGFIHRRAGTTDIYFVANDNNREVQADLTFRAAARSIQRWDPMDGGTHPVERVRVNSGRTTIPVTLGPHESAAFLFTADAPAPPPAARRASADIPVNGPWRVEFPDPVGRAYNWGRLRDWIANPETRHFSGLATYTAAITLAADPALSELDLGDVRESAEVFVNGRPAGIAIMRPYRVRVAGLLKPGRNTIEIRVANLWNNQIVAMPKSVSRVPGPGYGITEILYGPKERPLMSSGLLGPVRLTDSRVAGY